VCAKCAAEKMRERKKNKRAAPFPWRSCTYVTLVGLTGKQAGRRRSLGKTSVPLPHAHAALAVMFELIGLLEHDDGGRAK
jgi:hypothetical protein